MVRMSSCNTELLITATPTPQGTVIESLPVQTHEVALQIKLEDAGLSAVIAALRADVVVKPTDAIQRTFALAAAVAVFDKASVPPGVHLIE